MGDGIACVYNLNSFMSNEPLEFINATLGLALDLETSSIGVVLSSSIITNLNKPIPLSSGYSGQTINVIITTD